MGKPSIDWQEFREQGHEAFRNGEYDKASNFFTEALKHAQKFGGDDIRLAISMQDQSECYAVMNRLQPAKNMYQKSIDIMQRTLGPNHPKVIKSIDRYDELRRFIKKGT